MSSVFTTAHFQSDMERLFEKVLEIGTPLKIEYKGEMFVISVAGVPDKLANLQPHPDCLTGDPEDIVRMDWSREWKHDLP